jgi:hypothetical protein
MNDDHVYADAQYMGRLHRSITHQKKRLAGWVCLNGAQSLSPRRRGMPSRRVMRPKGDLISQKSGRRSIFLTQPHRQPLFFDEKYPLAVKNTPPMLLAVKSNILSINEGQGFCGQFFRIAPKNNIACIFNISFDAAFNVINSICHDVLFISILLLPSFLKGPGRTILYILLILPPLNLSFITPLNHSYILRNPETAPLP